MDNHWESEGGAYTKETFPDQTFPEAAGEPVEDYTDPFSPENVPVVEAITLLRCYDALMGILDALNPEEARKLHEVHAKGGMMGPPPGFDPAEVYDPNGDS